MTLKISDAFRLSEQIIGKAGSYQILELITGRSRNFPYLEPNYILKYREELNFRKRLMELEKGYPLEYMMSQANFYEDCFHISTEVLVPRPETEILVEILLKKTEDQKRGYLVDLGTGSGVIGLSFALKRAHWKVLLTDISLAALRIAQKNSNSLGTRNVDFLQSDWLKELKMEKSFDIVVSNPPYLREQEIVQPSFEPRQSLDGGKDGLKAYREIIKSARKILKTDGKLLLEHGFQQRSDLFSLLKDSGYRQIVYYEDYQHLPRFIEAGGAF